jgi:cell shape-determining protein MreC
VDNTEDLVKQLKAAFGGAKEAVEDFSETQKEIDRLKNSILDFFSITNTISLLKRTVNSATESIK